MQVLKTFAKHYKTEEPIPDEMLDALQVSKSLFQSIELQTQVFYSALDLEYHTNKEAPGHTTELLKRVQNEYHKLPFVENTVSIRTFNYAVRIHYL